MKILRFSTSPYFKVESVIDKKDFKIARNLQFGGNYKNFHHALVMLWGQLLSFGTKYTPLITC